MKFNYKPILSILLSMVLAFLFAIAPALAQGPIDSNQPSPPLKPSIKDIKCPDYDVNLPKNDNAGYLICKSPDPKFRDPYNMEPFVFHRDQDYKSQTKLNNFGKKPNILIFLLDDVGWGDLGFNGGGIARGAPTPNIDRIASEGLVLTSTYSQPSCSPSRATINTGQLPVHHGIYRPPMYDSKGSLPHRDYTLPSLLKNQGYITRAVGKWHLGESRKAQPQHNGYDEFFGFLGVSDEYTEWRDWYYNPEVKSSPQRTEYMENLDFNKKLICKVADLLPEDERVGDTEACRAFPGEVIDLNTVKTVDKKLTEYSVKFIHDMKRHNKEHNGVDKQPFFLYHGTRGCHFDNYPSEKYLGQSPAKVPFTDCLIQMDHDFGEIYKALEETDQLKDTFIFFTSDNGPEAEIWPDSGNAGPFKGFKGSTWEGGVRVPSFAYWKGMIEPGKSNGFFDQADLLPTILRLAGVNSSELSSMLNDHNRKVKKAVNKIYIDGVDQTSFLLADEPPFQPYDSRPSNRRSVIYWLKENFSAVRMDEFKGYVVGTELHTGLDMGNVGGFSGVTSKYSYMRIFNLYTDPGEKRNIMLRHLWMTPALTDEFARYCKVLLHYPIRGSASDAPLFDVCPITKFDTFITNVGEALEENATDTLLERISDTVEDVLEASQNENATDTLLERISDTVKNEREASTR
ncbi:MAG: sulfatase-like hydrolase/transferase [Prochloraceae cyanobacterium]|nr:sulfatase-like hydrolase/transferase [Prochloraceae cyanobacterium]